MIRATYGHSIELELDLPTDNIPEGLYWPCEEDQVETIMELGITAGDRKHVHLSKTIVKAMEAGHVRISRPAIIEVDTVRAIADGHTVYRAGKTVYLIDEVPGDYLYRVESDDPIITEIVAQPIETWKNSLINDFEAPIFLAHPVLQDIKNELYKQGALYASMSGSGSSLFGIFPATHTWSDTFMDNQFSTDFI